jgi:hypothetical protein
MEIRPAPGSFCFKKEGRQPIGKIGIDKVIRFLKDDPKYGGCAVMLGVPTGFRDLSVDTNPDPYLQELIASAAMVMPWMVQRFTPMLHREDARYEAQVKADLAWLFVPLELPGAMIAFQRFLD